MLGLVGQVRDLVSESEWSTAVTLLKVWRVGIAESCPQLGGSLVFETNALQRQVRGTSEKAAHFAVLACLCMPIVEAGK